MPNYLTSAQAATRLALKPETVVSYARSGKLPAALIGGAWRFAENDIQDFFENHRSK